MKVNEQDKDHDATLDRVLRVCRQANLKLNKDKCLFRCTSIPFYGEIILWQGISPDSRKEQALTHMPSPKSKKEQQLILNILNYLRKLSPLTAEACEPLQKLTFWRLTAHGTESTRTCIREKKIIKKDAYVKF